jgi:hypothetical protein
MTGPTIYSWVPVDNPRLPDDAELEVLTGMDVVQKILSDWLDTSFA